MPLPPVSEKKFTEGFGPGGATTGSLRIIVTGAGGFIASHLSKRLKAEAHSAAALQQWHISRWWRLWEKI